jgi:hypothetical protein
MSLHLRRRVRSALATVIDQIVAPFGYQVNVLVECGSPGVICYVGNCASRYVPSYDPKNPVDG